MNELIDFLDKYEENKTKKQRKPSYWKPESIKLLENELLQKKKAKYPNNPYPVKDILRDDTANELTKCVCKWLELNGYFSARINTTGTYSAKLGKWIHSGSKRGMADITAVINGKHISIEIKTGNDKPRPEQLKVKQEVEAAGGVYIFVRSFDDFLIQINEYHYE